jgi:esterase/lipase superfamily enzyme
MFNADPEVFRAQHAWTLARTNASKIRGRVAISMFVGTQDPGLENNRHMHAVLDEMKIPHDYREFDGIAHNLKLLADQVQDGNFAFAARSFKLPPVR